MNRLLTSDLRLLVSANARYAQHIVELMKSIIAFNRVTIELFIIHDEVANDVFSVAINQLAAYDKLTIHFLQIHKKRRIEIEKRDQGLIPLVLRIYLPDFKIDGRLIYLDLDTLVVGDITSLMTIDLQGKPIAAALDYLINLRLVTEKNYAIKKLSPNLRGVDWQYRYINNGVMVLDCDLLNRRQYADKWLNNLHTAYDNVMFEQDMINLVNRDDILELPNAYNFLYSHMLSCSKVAIALGWNKKYQQQQKKIIDHPKILHFAGKLKAWDKLDKRGKPNLAHQLFQSIIQLSISQIVAQPIEHFSELYRQWMDDHGLTYYMTDQFAGIKGLSREEIKYILATKKATSYSPYLLDYKAIKILAKPYLLYICKYFLKLK